MVEIKIVGDCRVIGTFFDAVVFFWWHILRRAYGMSCFSIIVSAIITKQYCFVMRMHYLCG